MREKLVEDAGVKYAIARGWTVYKWSSPGNQGIHDRLHLKGSCAFSIEYKATGEKASPKQRAEAVRLKAAGIPCRCIDNVSDAREFINIMTEIAESSSDPFLDMAVLSNDIRSFNP